jgi:hypothetical protein
VSTTSANAGTLNVHSSSFQVSVAAAGGSSWVQATQSGQTVPAYSGVLAAGQSQTFAVTGSLLLEMGSAAAHVTLTTGLHVLGTFVPTAAPYTLTIAGGA